MKKVLLLTWYDNNNYGTSLQASSLRSIICDPQITGLISESTEKFECDILRHQPERREPKSKFRKIVKVFQPKNYLMKYSQIRDSYIKRTKQKEFKARSLAFDNFTNLNFTFSSSINAQTEIELRRVSEKYNIIMSGSDQVWNPEALDPTYLLQWTPIGKKKVSYGSSLSMTKIPEKYYDIYRKSLPNFDAISIRDAQCREQLSQIVKRNVYTVVDPVILLGRRALSQRQRSIELGDKPYIFCYFLGNKVAHRKNAIKYAERHGLAIKAVVNCGFDFKADKDLQKYAIWDVDPNQFIFCIQNAKFVFTDSFHATVIATLLHKDFVVFEKDSNRPAQNTRIKEFLALAGLDERWEMSMNQLTSIDMDKWKAADARIDVARQKSFDYLMEALK